MQMMLRAPAVDVRQHLNDLSDTVNSQTDAVEECKSSSVYIVVIATPATKSILGVLSTGEKAKSIVNLLQLMFRT